MCNRISIIVTILVLLFTSECRQRDSSRIGEQTINHTVSFKGALEDGEGQMVVIEEMAAREYIPLDTVFCDESGAFELSFSPTEVAFYVLRYGASGYVTLLIEPGEDIFFSSRYNDHDIYEIKGSKGSELLQVLSLQHKETLENLSEITRKNMALAGSQDYKRFKLSFDRQFDSITTEFHTYSSRYIHDNAGSLAILVALYNLYGQGLPVFYPDKDLEIYQFVDSALMSKYSGFEAVDLLNAQVKEANRLLGDHNNRPQLQKGEIAPDFVSSRPDGSQMALSDLKGKYILISFWAGWSQLSREENPFLSKAMEVYGKQHFQILQVSLDDNRELWENAIKEDGLEWDQVSDLKRWDTPVSDLYQIEKIPSNILVSPSGRILETNLFGNKLINKLEEIFTN